MYGNVTWLLRNPDMYHLRAPGNTCLSALIGNEDSVVPDYIASPRNESKGCGGVMRVAPVALMPYGEPIEKIDMEGAEIAAITHGHSLGYMPAALLVHIIRRIVYPEQTMTLKEIVLEGCDTIHRLFRADAHVDRMVSIIQDAVRLSYSSVVTDIEAIHKLGAGWVGEEALAIAVFCALKYENDFNRALITSVNHGGDSDSTGAICGNILGAVVGYDGIGEEWKEHLELRDDILKLADEIIIGVAHGGHNSNRFSSPDGGTRLHEQLVPRGVQICRTSLFQRGTICDVSQSHAGRAIRSGERNHEFR